MNPRPESRIESVEKRATAIEAQIIEMSNDSAEEFRAIRQDIKQLDQGMKSSFTQIGDAFTLLDSNIEDVKATMANKDDIKNIKDDISRLEGLVMQLLQQKSGQ